jgi:hypothetical protein
MDDEKLIPLNIPPYQFGDEDKRLASQIEGLKFSHAINPKPFAPVFHFFIDGQTKLKNLEDFLKSLPDQFELQYFRPFDPDKSVAGTIVTAQKCESDYCFYNGSHGQDKVWKEITKEQLLNELFVYRQHQSFGTLRVARFSKSAIPGQKAY